MLLSRPPLQNALKPSLPGYRLSLVAHRADVHCGQQSAESKRGKPTSYPPVCNGFFLEGPGPGPRPELAAHTPDEPAVYRPAPVCMAVSQDARQTARPCHPSPCRSPRHPQSFHAQRPRSPEKPTPTGATRGNLAASASACRPRPPGKHWPVLDGSCSKTTPSPVRSLLPTPTGRIVPHMACLRTPHARSFVHDRRISLRHVLRMRGFRPITAAQGGATATCRQHCGRRDTRQPSSMLTLRPAESGL